MNIFRGLPRTVQIGIAGLAVALALGALAFAGIKYGVFGTVTLAKYEKIQVGDTRADVAKIMGFAGVEESRRSNDSGAPAVGNDVADLYTRNLAMETVTVVAWKNWGGSGVWCTFSNNVLRDKRQKGLTR